MAVEKIEGIVVESDNDRRMRLRQACMSIPQLTKVVAVATAEEAIRRLDRKDCEDCTAVFVSVRFARELIIDFVQCAKRTLRGKDSAFILVLEAGDQDGKQMAQNLLDGVDGFLLEPFSVDSLVEITQVALVIKRQRQAAREEATVTLLINDALAHLDLVAERIVRGAQGGAELKYLRDLKSAIGDLNERMDQLYIRMLIQKLPKSPAPLLTLKQEGDGQASMKHRVHMRVIEKLRARGIEVSEEDALGSDDQSHLWEIIPTDGSTRTIVLKSPLYDKPCGELLTNLLGKMAEEAAQVIVIDFGETSIVSSYALGKLLRARDLFEKQGKKLIVSYPKGLLGEIFDILKLSRIFASQTTISASQYTERTNNRGREEI